LIEILDNHKDDKRYDHKIKNAPGKIANAKNTDLNGSPIPCRSHQSDDRMMRSSTRAFTTLPTAAPITTPTAIPTTPCFSKKDLNSSTTVSFNGLGV